MKPRRLKKHRITVTLTVEESITRKAAADYIVGAIAEMHGCHPFRYSSENEEAGLGDLTESDEVLCGEVLNVRTAECYWSKKE